MGKNNIPLIITFLLLYFGGCGGLWHIGYWSTFDINYLQYINLVDIIKSFVFPFITSTGTALIGFIFTTLANYHDRIDDPNSLIFGKGRNTRAGIFLNKYVVLIVSIYIVLIVNLAIFGGEEKWIVIPFLIAGPLSIYLTNRNILFKAIINPDLRSSFITFILLLPFLSFGSAKRESINIFDNISYKKIIEVCTNGDNKMDKIIGLKYLGSADNKTFLTDSINSVILILNTTNINYIKYKTIKK